MLVFPAMTSGGYQIARSLRFNSPDTAYLTRTPGGAGTGAGKTGTISIWFKRNAIGAEHDLYNTSTDLYIYIGSNDKLRIGNSVADWRVSNLLLRDTTAWYHLVVQLDTGNATGSSRVLAFLNGVAVTWSATSDPALNTDTKFLQAQAQQLGRNAAAAGYCDTYMSEVALVDGSVVAASSFGATDATTGAWNPKTIGGITWGTNGAYLKFADNSNTTAATLGKDSSGNGNNWTPNNFSVTAGTGNDSLTDTPTNYGTDTGVGGEVRGNFATLNPLANASGTMNNGALFLGGAGGAYSTQMVASGKIVAEMTVSPGGAGTMDFGLMIDGQNPASATTNRIAYRSDGNKVADASVVAYGATYTTNDVIRCEADITNNTLTFFKNGTTQGAISYTFAAGLWGFYLSNGANFSCYMNFGQRPFANTATANYKCLCTQNLSTPTIVKSATAYAANLRTGTGATATVSGMSFAPDLVWVKSRSNATDHALFDTQRTVTKGLVSDTTGAEYTQADTLTTFNSDGYILGADATKLSVNVSTRTYVDWCWRKGATYGFDVVLGTMGSGTTAFSHSLGATPSMFVVKCRNAATDWGVYHTTLGNTNCLDLNDTSASTARATAFGNTSPTSTQFSLGNYFVSNGNTFVTYLWAPIAGFSAFGSYTGNGSADGPFVSCGFRPAYLIVKRTDVANDWYIFDTARGTYNENGAQLAADAAVAESLSVGYDLDAVGFKTRNSAAAFNAAGGTYVSASFAAFPFKYARAA